ncbi:MAG TPA: hypothetical protein VLG27_05075 [Candidatus Saccharimonadia bacterium]|nr:hypothetical protein [Candidatus Saccharimonadia bacterium]
MAESKKPSEPVNDVAPADRTAAEPSSKPIIVTNRPIMKDPMVVEGSEPASDMEESAGEIVPVKLSGKSELKLGTDKPSAEATKPAEAKPAEPETKEEAPAPAAASAPEPKADEAAKDDKTEESASEPTNPDAAAIDEAEAAKQAEHDTAIQKLVDSKQYYLPVNAVEKRKSRRFVLLGIVLSILLVVAWADIALDAGLVASGSSLPHTHLFDNATPAVAPAAPVVTNKVYKASASKLTFRYPSNWQFSSAGSSATLDNVLINPKSSGDIRADTAAGAIALSFSNIPTPPLSNPRALTVKYVHYQTLSHQIHGPVYLRDVVYQDPSGHINVNSSLGDTNIVKVGDSLSGIDQTFTNADGKPLDFEAVVIKTTPAQNGFSSVQEAQQFLKSSGYQSARSILLSTMATKN